MTEVPSSSGAESLLRGAIDAAPTAVIVTDDRGSIREWNAAAGQLLGHSRDGVVGEDISAVVPGIGAAALGAARLSRFRPSGGSPAAPQTVRLTARRSDGSEVTLDIAVAALPPAATPTGFGWYLAPAAAGTGGGEGQIRELERLLADARTQLDATNRELEAFSYSVSHDLRAPLRHIDGFASMLVAEAGKGLDEQSTRYLTVIVNAAKKMGRLIDDLLSYSRTGRAEMTLRSVNLNEVVEAVRIQLKPAIGDRTIQWDVARIPEVAGDWTLLTRVFANLIDNAIKFTRPRADARITVGTASGAEGEVVVFVRDNGVGFNPKYAGRMFGVFQRLHSDTEFEGSGVGLANVQRIVRRHGGRIWAEGAVDGGATFYVALPAANRPGSAAGEAGGI